MNPFQYFAAEAAEAAGDGAAEAAQSPETGERVPFETLIAGEYREDFQKKTEELLRKRFKNQPKRDREGDYAALLRQAGAAREAYPEFDLRRELSEPRFAALVLKGVDARTAYEAVHHESMVQAAMAFGVRQAAKKLASARMSGRPAENGGAAAAVERPDPRRLTPRQREEIRRRVLEKGERVHF